jgi:hypothetical protein
MRQSKRRITWVSFGWTLVAAILAYLIYRHNQHVCDTSLLGARGCKDVGAEPSYWSPFVRVWVVGMVVLGIVWLVIRPKRRVCPVCGENVQKGRQACPSCGHDFSVAAIVGGSAAGPSDSGSLSSPADPALDEVSSSDGAGRSVPGEPSSSAAGTKVCPACAETVKSAALVCRYCQHHFVEPVAT